MKNNIANLLIIIISMVTILAAKEPVKVPDCSKDDSSDYCKADKIL